MSGVPIEMGNNKDINTVRIYILLDFITVVDNNIFFFIVHYLLRSMHYT